MNMVLLSVHHKHLIAPVSMPNVSCKVCAKPFQDKISRIKKGWGDYCSNSCKYLGMKTGRLYQCSTCNKSLYRTAGQQKKSKDGKFFCNKSCFARWKNTLWSFGKKHFNWRGGESVYRDIMLRNNIPATCSNCSIHDLRVLVVHHIDENRKNNIIENLKWLCRNCHYLVHNRKTF